MKSEVCAAVSKFFYTGNMLPAINCTLITLIPKVLNPTLVKDYRPIACCTILYKIIAKILTNKMHCMISSVIDLAQSGFIPGRNISDNILLATELIKGYTNKNISPRCMLKIDLKKAYDSIEWSFLESVMCEIGFPTKFVG